MKPSFALFVASSFVMVAIGFGCASTPDARIEKNQELFDSYPPAVQAKIRAGKVQVGFSEDMVRMALGEPNETTLEVTESGETVMWGYTTSRPGFSVGIGGGGYGSGSAGGAGVRMGSGPRKDYTAIVEYQAGVVTKVRYFTQ